MEREKKRKRKHKYMNISYDREWVTTAGEDIKQVIKGHYEQSNSNRFENRCEE